MKLSWSPRWLTLPSQDTTTTCPRQGSRRLASTRPQDHKDPTRIRGITRPVLAGLRGLLKAKALLKVRIVSLLYTDGVLTYFAQTTMLRALLRAPSYRTNRHRHHSTLRDPRYPPMRRLLSTFQSARALAPLGPSRAAACLRRSRLPSTRRLPAKPRRSMGPILSLTSGPRVHTAPRS